MTEFIIQHLERFVELAKVWGPLLILVCMAIESSIFPLPSEVVMIPAGFMAARGELVWSHGPTAAAVAVLCGAVGSQAGAYFNYYLALWLGRPFLYRYGKWFFLSPPRLQRAEEIFREYGDVTTFVCRLLPVIRHLISLPAGLARMGHWRFTAFTTSGAALWCIILTAIGYHFGRRMQHLSYAELVHAGIRLLHQNLGWIVLGCAAVFGGYVLIHRAVMRRRAPPAPPPAAT